MSKEVKARMGFEHNGRRVRGEKFTVSDKYAEQLVKKGLVSVVGGAVEQEKPAPNDSTVPPVVQTEAEKFVAGTIAEVTAAIEGTDKDLLKGALAAEMAKGEKARKGVIDALTAATAD